MFTRINMYSFANHDKERSLSTKVNIIWKEHSNKVLLLILSPHLVKKKKKRRETW